MHRFVALLLGLSVVVASVAASAQQVRRSVRRVALLVANHEGGEELPRLRYAARDADRLRDVLVEVGGFKADDIVTVIDEDSDEVLQELAKLESRIKRIRHRGQEVVLVVYYSGHAENGVLRMGDSRLAMQKLKERISASDADVRLAFLDSCGAGAMTREKGGSAAPPFVISVDDVVDRVKAAGQVIITSSSADEASQESDDIQGSFFTHYLTTGLRGAADTSGDGRVTLDEAYAYAYARTVATTANTRSGAQHPTYQYELSGSGDVVLTKPGGADVVIRFPEESEGRFFVVDLDRQLFVAEVDKARGSPQRISLPVGEYAVKKRMDTHLLMTRVAAREKGSFTIDEDAMEQVAFEDDYAKGTPILNADLEKGLGFSMSIGTGGQVMWIDPTAGQFPPTVFVTLEGRLTNVFTEHLMLSADLGFSTRGHSYQFQDGSGAVDLWYTQAQFGATAFFTWSFELFEIGDFELGEIELAAGPRQAIMLVLANYEDPVQGNLHWYSTVAPGLVGLVGYKPLSWFHVEAQVRSNATMSIQFEPILYSEVLLSAWVDF